jgi:transposase
MLADEIEFVIGVDTHAASHTLVLLEAATQVRRRTLTLPADRDGYRRALRFAARSAPGRRAWALEGSGCYGAGLARGLERAGEQVLEVERPRRPGLRGRLKSDELDAERAARALLSGQAGAQPRRGGEREALRVLLVAREAAVAVRSSGLNRLRALVVTAPEPLRARLRERTQASLVKACLRLRSDQRLASEQRAYLLSLRGCARRVRAATLEAATLERELRTLLERHWPRLLAEPGVGPISAAQLVVSWSHPGRLRSEAAFARLAGVAPLEASSGKVIRHRLDRGGDRRLNRALHTIMLSRRRHHPETIAYHERRLSEGKSSAETNRCLKRYLARSLFRMLETTPPSA